MKTKYYSSAIEKEAIDAINFFYKIDENIPEKEHIERRKMVREDKLTFLQFISDNEETEFNEFLRQYKEKYSHLFEQYREMKKLQQLITIKKIAVYFFVISLLSIVAGLIITNLALS